MPAALDETIPLPEHFARYGFAVCRGLVDPDFCAAASARAREVVGSSRPLREWTSDVEPVLHKAYFERGEVRDEVFERLFEQPSLRAAIETLFGGPGHWNEEKNYYLFVKPFNPKGAAKITRPGHIDFPGQPIPALYRGFTFQVLLADNEPFSGNLTLHPGTHAMVQRLVIDNPEYRAKSGHLEGVPDVEPYEFVGRAGDVCFMHHLVLHSGNDSHAAGRSPRIAIHAEAFRDEWLESIDPSDPRLSPWERSLAHNGPHRPSRETEVENTKKREEYYATLRKGAEAARY